jgi:regulator of protease activity HflC (stomatin/prohibitin superfamily)
MTSRSDVKTAAGGVLVIALGVALLVGMIIGTIWGFKAFNRSQRVADAENKVTTSQIEANNQVEINRIRIDQQEQRVKIAEQEAEVRLREAQGVRAAQDEIAKTLTPQYIQYEMVKSLEKIGKSGRNNTVVYVPVGADGLPIVADATHK